MRNDIDTDIIPRQTVSAIVENVDLAKKDVAEAFQLLINAKSRLNHALGGGGVEDSSFYHHLFDRDISDYDLPGHCEASQKRITKNAWRYILDQTGLSQYMTSRRKDELYKEIEEGTLPPLTAENIHGTLVGMAGKMNDLMVESIREVFDWLRPQNNYGVGMLKTNKKFSIGERAIVGYSISSNYSGGYQFQYQNTDRFTSLGNVFSILDGKGVLQNPYDLVTRCRIAMDAKADKFEDDYFRFKFFSNGNCHIKFKRLDLLKELNRIGGGVGLPERDIRMKKDTSKTAVAVI